MTLTQRKQYVKKLLDYVHKKQDEGKVAEASAELNALTRHLPEVTLVYLLHTDTHLGRCCAEALKEYLTKRGIQVAEPIEVQGLHGPGTN